MPLDRVRCEARYSLSKRERKSPSEEKVGGSASPPPAPVAGVLRGADGLAPKVGVRDVWARSRSGFRCMCASGTFTRPGRPSFDECARVPLFPAEPPPLPPFPWSTLSERFLPLDLVFSEVSGGWSPVRTLLRSRPPDPCVVSKVGAYEVDDGSSDKRRLFIPEAGDHASDVDLRRPLGAGFSFFESAVAAAAASLPK